MTGPVPEEDPEPRDVLKDPDTPDDVEHIEAQNQQPPPENIEAPDAG